MSPEEFEAAMVWELEKATTLDAQHWSQWVTDGRDDAIVVVTPDLAQHWLDYHNDNNYRFFAELKAKKWAKFMESKMFREGIKDSPVAFDWNGALRNGQHRLGGVVIFGGPVRLRVVRGCSPDEFLVWDKGTPRTVGDDLRHLGIQFGTRDEHQKGTAVVRRMVSGLRGGNDLGAIHSVAQEFAALVGAFVRAMASSQPNRAEITAAFCKGTFEFDREGEEGCLAVATRFADRTFSGKGDPLNRLYEHALRAKIGKVSANDLYALAVSAFRAAMRGRDIGALYPATEDFRGPWERGYVPIAAREKARRAAATARANAADAAANATDDDALALVEEVRNAGGQFDMDGGDVRVKWKQMTPPTLIRRVNMMRERIGNVLRSNA